MASTYTPIATQTLVSAQTDVTFNSFSGYTDLILIIRGNNTSGGNRAAYIQFNSDTGANYSYTQMFGDGSSATSSRAASQNQSFLGNFLNDNTAVVAQFQNYSNATTYKTFLSRANSASTVVQANVNLWRSTSAITSMKLYLNADQWAIGTSFTLYGIQGA